MYSYFGYIRNFNYWKFSKYLRYKITKYLNYKLDQQRKQH
jgi:hypothetical protein